MYVGHLEVEKTSLNELGTNIFDLDIFELYHLVIYQLTHNVLRNAMKQITLKSFKRYSQKTIGVEMMIYHHVHCSRCCIGGGPL